MNGAEWDVHSRRSRKLHFRPGDKNVPWTKRFTRRKERRTAQLDIREELNDE